MTMEERKAKGMLWTDTPEAMEAQKKARGLCYDFNHTHPSEREKGAGNYSEALERVCGLSLR